MREKVGVGIAACPNSIGMRPEVVGLRFLPTDQELVIGYLLGKLTGSALPSEKYVFDCDLYGGEEPWEIWARFRGGAGGACSGFRYFGDDKEEDLYFLTPMKKKNPTAIRFERSVGSSGGTWHEESSKVSTSSDGRVSWVTRRLCYKRKKKTNRNQNQEQQSNDGGAFDDQVAWIMHEYTLDQPLPWLGIDGASFKSYALCRIRKKEIPNSKKRKLGAAADEPPMVFLVEIDEDGSSEDEMMGIMPPADFTTATTSSFSDHSVSAAAAAPNFAIISSSSFFPYSVPASSIATSSYNHYVPDPAVVTTSSSDHSVPAPAIVASSSSNHSVPAAATATTSASTAAVPRKDSLAQVLMTPNPDWNTIDLEEILLGDEFCGGPVEFCCQSNGNALPLRC